MFRLATCDFRDRRVLLVESDSGISKAVSASIAASGGTIVGISASVDGAIKIVSTIELDVVFLDASFAAGSVPLSQRFGPFGVELAFHVGFDDWFDADDYIFENVLLRWID